MPRLKDVRQCINVYIIYNCVYNSHGCMYSYRIIASVTHTNVYNTYAYTYAYASYTREYTVTI